MLRPSPSFPLRAATLAATLFLLACSPQEEATESQAEVVRPVKLYTVQSTQARNIRQFPAELQASQEADLAFRVGGQLKQLLVVEGQLIKKGELLAMLDPTDFALQVDLAEANIRLAKAQFSRIQAMYKQKATTQAQYDEARASLDQAENALATARNQLAYTKLYAPFDGVVSSVMTENHQYVQGTQALMHVQNNQTIDVTFQIPEALIAHIQRSEIDYKPNVTLDVAPNVVYLASYKKHSTVPNPQTKAYDVTLTLERGDDSQLTLLPGMTANVEVDLSRLIADRHHILVPVEAVFAGDNTQADVRQVWVYNQQTQHVTQRNVKVGILQDRNIEILEGLEPGDQIVAAGVHTLTADMSVRPWTRERGL